jgi:transcription initiation factor IIF auxiliary subunit
VPPDYFLGRNASQLRRERELAQIRAGVQAPVIDAARQPAIREFSESDTQCIVAVSPTGEGRRRAALPASIASPQEAVEALSSRFYIRKRILIGNYARRLDNSLGEAEAAQREIPTHEWRLFVRPFDASDDIESYVREVRFTLHPSYRPNDVIAVTSRPFELRLSGWGEFPARIELHFRDRKSKPALFVHHLRLWACHSRVFALMSEQAYDLDLDRKTAERDTDREREGGRDKAAPLTVEDALAINSRHFPLFGALPKAAPPAVSYNRAVSYAEFIRLPAFDQLVLERERALALQRHLLPAFPGLALDHVLDWCRRSGLSPSSAAASLPGGAPAEEDAGDARPGAQLTAEALRGLHFCRYCGLAHFPQERFEVLQKNCSMRPRKLHLSSRTTAAEIIAGFAVAAEPPAVEPKRPRVIETAAEANPAARQQPQLQPEAWGPEEAWVNAAVLPLELPAYRPRQPVCHLVAKALRAFLGDLLRGSHAQLPDTIERAVGRPAILTPLHLYQAITGTVPVSAIASKDHGHHHKGDDAAEAPTPKEASTRDSVNRFDFLSNAFMAGT